MRCRGEHRVLFPLVMKRVCKPRLVSQTAYDDEASIEYLSYGEARRVRPHRAASGGPGDGGVVGECGRGAPGRGGAENKHSTDGELTNRVRTSVCAFTLEVRHAPISVGWVCSQWPSWPVRRRLRQKYGGGTSQRGGGAFAAPQAIRPGGVPTKTSHIPREMSLFMGHEVGTRRCSPHP